MVDQAYQEVEAYHPCQEAVGRPCLAEQEDHPFQEELAGHLSLAEEAFHLEEAAFPYLEELEDHPYQVEEEDRHLPVEVGHPLEAAAYHHPYQVVEEDLPSLEVEDHQLLAGLEEQVGLQYQVAQVVAGDRQLLLEDPVEEANRQVLQEVLVVEEDRPFE